MGLDMFLYAKRDLWSSNKNDKVVESSIRSVLPEIEGMEVRSIKVEAGYWRKAYQIHRWFVENIQDGEDDCRDADVFRDQLGDLLDLCRKVMANQSRAEELLPTSKGFFFGGTNYDNLYWEDIEHTIMVLEKCLALPKDWYFTYRSSW